MELTLDVGRDAGGHLVALLVGALADAVANEAHLGRAVDLVQHQPRIIAAQLVLHFISQLEPADVVALSILRPCEARLSDASLNAASDWSRKPLPIKVGENIHILKMKLLRQL